jgi:hypothetical protein
VYIALSASVYRLIPNFIALVDRHAGDHAKDQTK